MRDILYFSPRFDKATEVSNDYFEDLKVKENISTRDILERENATRENLEKKIKDYNILAFWDHGQSDALVANDNQNTVDNNNLDLFKGKEIWTVACLSGKELGPKAIKQGVSFYQGYTDVITITSVPPFKDFFCDALNAGIRERKKGRPLFFCKLKQKRSFRRGINQCHKLSSMGGLFFEKLLKFNFDHLVYLGG